MKRISKIFAAVLVVAVMLSCLGVGALAADEPRTITIGTWWDIFYDSTHTALEDDPSYTGSVSDQMRFDVVKAVEEKFNVKFQYVNLTYTGITESINTSILAGTPECDIYLCDLSMGIPAAVNGLALDLKTVLPEDADILSDQTVLNYLDLGDGKVCLMKQVLGQNVVEATSPLAFNKQMLEDNNLEDPRDLYARGEWTWDKFVEYCQTLTQDSSAATGEALQFYYDLYNTYNVCEPYVEQDNGDVMRFTYRNGNIGFWPSAAWIASTNADYDWDGSVGSTLEFDTVFVQWPTGPSGDQETNKAKLTAGAFWFIPNGVEDPELVYNVFEALSNWYNDDVGIRDDKETMWWWYATTASDPDLQESNYDVMFDLGSREQFDVYQSLEAQVDGWDLEQLIFGTMTAAQYQETYRQQFQAAIDSYFG